ncbi:transposase [Pseudacidovorax sp. 1753]
MTLTLLWEEYRAAHPGERTWGFTQFCEHYERYARTLKRSMRQQHRAGEKLFAHYAGPTLALADGARGQVREVLARIADHPVSRIEGLLRMPLVGVLPRGQLCPYQKHPWTKMTTLCRFNTMSGLPGSSA